MPSYGQVFFTLPPGTSTTSVIPQLSGPENTTLRSVMEQIASGTYFDRLNWKLVGLFSETARQQGLLSEKSGIADGRYAINYEWSLLLTGGYDAISGPVLVRNVSGPVAMGGFGLTLGQDFSFQAEAGERYNSPSFNGNLRYNLSPSSMLTAIATDFVQTPESQLLNNLTNLAALPTGQLTAMNNILENGTTSSFGSFNVQSPDNPSLDQFISRYQTAAVSFIEKFERTDVTISLFGTRRTLLSARVPRRSPADTADTWGTEIRAARHISPLLTVSLEAGPITDTQQFGGQASTINVTGEVDYTLSRTTSIYFQSGYVDRLSSSSLQALSPFSGNVSDFRATVGITRALW